MPGLMPGLDDRLRRGRRKDEEGNLMPVHWQFSRKMKNGERVFGDEFLKRKRFGYYSSQPRTLLWTDPRAGQGLIFIATSNWEMRLKQEQTCPKTISGGGHGLWYGFIFETWVYYTDFPGQWHLIGYYPGPFHKRLRWGGGMGILLPRIDFSNRRTLPGWLLEFPLLRSPRGGEGGGAGKSVGWLQIPRSTRIGLSCGWMGEGQEPSWG